MKNLLTLFLFFLGSTTLFSQSQLNFDGSSPISDVNQINTVRISSYPNPFNSTVLLEWGSNEFHALTIFNCLGQEVYQQSIEGGESAELDLSFLERGTYFVKMMLENNQEKDAAALKLFKI